MKTNKSFTIVHRLFKGGEYYEMTTDSELQSELIKENEQLLYEVDILQAQIKAFKPKSKTSIFNFLNKFK